MMRESAAAATPTEDPEYRAERFDKWCRLLFEITKFFTLSFLKTQRVRERLDRLLEKNFLPWEEEALRCIRLFVVEVEAAFLLRDQLRDRLGRIFVRGEILVCMDVARMLESHPCVPFPPDEVRSTQLAQFTAGPHLFLSNRDWGRPSAFSQEVLSFLRLLPVTLVKTVKIAFFDCEQKGVDYEPLVDIFLTWENLEEMTLKTMVGVDLDESVQEMVRRVKPRSLRLRGDFCLQSMRLLSSFDGLEDFDMLFCQPLTSIPESVEHAWRSLPKTVHRVSLRMHRVSLRMQRVDVGTTIRDLNRCLAVLPSHVDSLILAGFDFWDDQKIVERIFGTDQFVELGLYNTETTEDRIEPRPGAAFLRDKLRERCRVSVLRTSRFSMSIAAIVTELDELRTLHFNTTFPGRRYFNADRYRFIPAIRRSALTKLIYDGPVSTTPHLINAQEILKAMNMESLALQRARCLLHVLETRSATCDSDTEISLGAIPLHVLEPCVVQTGQRIAHDVEQLEKKEEQAKRELFDIVEMVISDDLFRERIDLDLQFHKILDEFSSKEDWLNAYSFIVGFLFFCGALKTPEQLSLLMQKKRRQGQDRKRTEREAFFVEVLEGEPDQKRDKTE